MIVILNNLTDTAFRWHAMNDFKEYTLSEFLLGRNTNFRTKLPLVHSSKSSNLLSVLSAQEIKTTPCDTFTGETLAYFFLGKPAYRKIIKSPKDWELPFVLIFESTCLLNSNRVFPFDSGAFLSGRLPSFISDFKSDGYEVSANQSAIDLLIEIFFGDDNRYYHGQAFDEEKFDENNDLGINHSQVRALCSLYREKRTHHDDRVLAIEVQTDQHVKLDDKLLGAVLPFAYKVNPNVSEFFEDRDVLLKSYDLYPIDSGGYVAQIHSLVKSIYEELGLMNG